VDDLKDLESNFSQNPLEEPPQHPFAPVNPKQAWRCSSLSTYVRICLKIVPNSRQALTQRRALLKEEQRQEKGCCGGSSHGFWAKVLNLPVVGGGETQTKRKECGISCIAITKYHQIWSSWGNERSLRFSHCIHYLASEPWKAMRWCGHSFRPKAIIVVLGLLKAGFNNRKFSVGVSNLFNAKRTNPSWLIFCLRNGKTKIFFNFRFLTPSKKFSTKRFSLALRERDHCQEISIYNHHPHILQ